ncbi:pectate lyase-domain-containing protein [Aspergillus heterothallicus]
MPLLPLTLLPLTLLLTSALAAPALLHDRFLQTQSLQKRFTFPLPTSTGSVTFDAPYEIAAGEVYDGELQTFGRGVSCNGQTEGGQSDTVFVLQAGATLRNAIIGPDQSEGVYCLGSCTIENVWWEQVCEDALSLKGDEAGTYNVIGGGAQGAQDKVIQHNSGGTVTIDGFTVYDFGKLYRSCGTCGDIQRSAVIKNVVAVQGMTLAGANQNFGDVVTIESSSCATDVSAICQTYDADAGGGEPEKISEDPTDACVFSALPACGDDAVGSASSSSGSSGGSATSAGGGELGPSSTPSVTPEEGGESETEEVSEETSNEETSNEGEDEEDSEEDESTGDDEQEEDDDDSVESSEQEDSSNWSWGNWGNWRNQEETSGDESNESQNDWWSGWW